MDSLDRSVATDLRLWFALVLLVAAFNFLS